jgi:chromosome segregation ATPase
MSDHCDAHERHASNCRNCHHALWGEHQSIKAQLDGARRIYQNAEGQVAVLRSQLAASDKQLLAVHDALHRECDGTADLPKEIRNLRQERDALRTAAQGAIEWMHDPNDPEQFERIAADFTRATGFTRPGKDVHPAAMEDPKAASRAWETWRMERSRAVRRALVEALR